jgi:hypothetical protein
MGERKAVLSQKRTQFELPEQACSHYPQGAGTRPAAVIPPERLVMSKARTEGIERNHCRQRHWFGRLKRKSIIVSKAQDMVELTMALFPRFRVNGDVAEIFTLDMIT